MFFSRQSIIYLTVATLLFLSVYSYFQFLEYKKYTSYVEHTYETLNANEVVEVNLLHLLRLRREYILFQNDTTKQLIIEAHRNLLLSVDTLKLMTDDNKNQVRNLKDINTLLHIAHLDKDTWFADADNPVSLDSMKMEVQRNRTVLETIFREFDQVKTIEKKLLRLRINFQQESGSAIPLMLLVTGLTSIIMLIYAFQMTNSDLKGRIRAQKALEKNNHQLNLANEELERFAFIASHNLKEPLRKSRTFISRILPESDPQSSVYPYLIKTEQTLGRLQHLLDDLLVFTKLLHHDEKKELLDLEQIIDTAADGFKEEMSKLSATILTGELPAVQGFRYQVELVFQHLISNSLKYHRPDVPPIISISSQFNEESGHHVILFADNGIGFDADYTQKIFEIFGRLHSQDEYEGTGIGLAICRRVMFNHDGFISAESSAGNGVRFSLYFPV